MTVSNQTNTNLSLWDLVKTPSKKYTKEVKMRGGFTAVDPQYLIQEATRQFGPYGKGFGISASEFDFSLLDKCNFVIHKAVFFYVLNGERSEFPITNSVEVISRKGVVDNDFAKKAETNTLSKALSKIGFAADVYMGMFDDVDYVRGVEAEQAIKEADDREAKQREEYQKIKTYIDEQIKSVQSMSNPAQAVKAYNRVIEKVDIRCKAAGFGSKGLIQLVINEQEKLGVKNEN